jgi:hypothetical protein
MEIFVRIHSDWPGTRKISPYPAPAACSWKPPSRHVINRGENSKVNPGSLILARRIVEQSGLFLKTSPSTRRPWRQHGYLWTQKVGLTLAAGIVSARFHLNEKKRVPWQVYFNKSRTPDLNAMWLKPAVFWVDKWHKRVCFEFTQ